MSDTIQDLQKKVDELEKRNWKLAREKSNLRTISYLYSSLSAAKGLKEVVKKIFDLIMDLYGSTSIIIYYNLPESWYAYGLNYSYEQVQLELDSLALATYTRKEMVILEDKDPTTSYFNLPLPRGSTTNSIGFPLIVQEEIIGIIKMEGIVLVKDQNIEELFTFFQYAALVLNNEIMNFIRLQESYDQIKSARDKLAEKVKELTQSEAKLRASLDERNFLLKEVYHRVKNNLQVITGLITLQASTVKDPDLKEHFAIIKNRIKSMGLIHERLYQSENLSRINFSNYIRELTDQLLLTYPNNQNSLTIEYDLEENIYLNVETAIPCGLILNEIVSNSVKYAFPGGQKGIISICLSKQTEEGNFLLIIGDNGVGIPGEVNFEQNCGMGFKLIKGFISKLRGSIQLDRTAGTRYTILFSLIKE